MNRLIIITLLCCCSAFAFASPNTQVADTLSSLELPLPAVPSMLRHPAERADYIISHFWDAMDFHDAARSHNRNFMEQNFSNFISVFPYADETSQRDAVHTLLQKAEADSAAYVLLVGIAEKYLYEPDSPMFSEDFYLLFLEHIAAAQVSYGLNLTRYRYQAEAVRKNRPGMTAADFSYQGRDGHRTTLHQTDTKGRRLLLIFYDPDCDHCKEIMGTLQRQPLLQQVVADGRLTVLAIYAGEDRALWDETAPLLPAHWHVGFDTGQIEERGLYVLRALPSLYLLDADKRVILKDVLPDVLFEYLRGE